MELTPELVFTVFTPEVVYETLRVFGEELYGLTFPVGPMDSAPEEFLQSEEFDRVKTAVWEHPAFVDVVTRAWEQLGHA